MKDIAEPEPVVRWARRLGPGQLAQLFLFDTQTATSRLLFQSQETLFEAPNWHPDGRWLVVNADGMLFRISSENPEQLELIDGEQLPELNNDHLISPDGRWHYVSANDGHIYRVAWGGGQSTRVTTVKHADRHFRHFLHGIDASGTVLAYVGTELQDGDEWGRRALWLLDLTNGEETLVGEGYSPADGPDFSADGRHIYFNSEFRSTVDGHAQLFSHELDTGRTRQLTFDTRVNWFPHPSPRGDRLVYLSYPPGTLGHPADLPVVIRMLDLPDGQPRDLVSLYGGQGTINVGSWSPDGRYVAYVAYPFQD